jgi:molybdopterin-biosynthesis enzyme MoeA-like protein
MKFGAIIIGDEILSGKRKDGHLARTIEALGTRGLQLAWARYLGDDPGLIAGTLRGTFGEGDAAFCFGGIGATPDDHTRAAAASAAGVSLRLHPDAEAEIRARFAADPKGVTPQRLAMGEFPEGARIIPNPYNRIPGFTFRGHHFLPGFPQMAWPMLEWVLETHYREAFAPGSIVESSIIVREAGESQLIELMRECQRRHPGAKVFSLPRVEPERFIELGARGEPAAVQGAIAVLKDGVSSLGFSWTENRAAQ